MNTELKQVLINQIDDSVSKGYFQSEQEAVEKALLAIREEEIMAKLELGRQQVKDGKVSSLKGTADKVINMLRLKHEAQG